MVKYKNQFVLTSCAYIHTHQKKETKSLFLNQKLKEVEYLGW